MQRVTHKGGGALIVLRSQPAVFSHPGVTAEQAKFVPTYIPRQDENMQNAAHNGEEVEFQGR